MAGRGLETVYRNYIDEFARYAFQEVDLRRLAGHQDVDIGRLDFRGSLSAQKLRFRGVIRHEIASISSGFHDEFAALADALRNDAPIVDGLDAVLAADPILGAVDTDRRDAYCRVHQRDLVRTARALDPLVGATDAWAAIRREWSLDGAQHRLLRWFDATTDHGRFADDISMTVDTTTVAWLPLDTVDYGREALRVLERGREYIARVIGTDLEAAFADRSPVTASV